MHKSAYISFISSFTAKYHNTAILAVIVWDFGEWIQLNCRRQPALSTATLPMTLQPTGLLFEHEIRCIWMRRWSFFSVLWFLVSKLRDVLTTASHRVVPQLRYPIIISHVFTVVSFSSQGWPAEVCMSPVFQKSIVDCLCSCTSSPLCSFRL